MLKTTASEKKAEYCAQDENENDPDCACYRGVNKYIENSKTAIATYNQEMTAYDAEKKAINAQMLADGVTRDNEKDNYRKSLSDALIKLNSYDCFCCGVGQNCACDLDKYTIAEGSQLRDKFFLETKDLKKVGQGPQPKTKGACGCKISCEIKESTQLARMDYWDATYPPKNRSDYDWPTLPTLKLPSANIICNECKNIIKNINENSDLEDIRQECNISIYEEQQGRKKKDGGEGKGEGKGEGGSGGKGAPNLSLGLIFGIVLCGLGVLLLIIGIILKFRGK